MCTYPDSPSIKQTLTTVLLTALLLSLTACPATMKGGYIKVTNGRAAAVSVDLTDSNYRPLYGDTLLQPDRYVRFWIEDDGDYWVRVYEDFRRSPYQRVSVNGSDTVTVRIE